jgi:hypothetical protein
MVAPSFLPADHPVEWLTAAPLWTEALKDPSQVRYRQPALLRFASDQFMDDLAGLLQSKPAELKGLVARAETWEQERVGWAPLAQVAGEKTLKLYQPAHNRFYMVAATLACHRAGLPDRAIANDRQEKAGFVLRRLVKNPKAKQINPNDPRTYTEYGWATGGSRTGWFPATQARSALKDEERMPLFPMNYCDGERKRRLLVGFIPVASRETYQAGPDLSPLVVPGSTPGEPDLRTDRFETRVTTPLKLLKDAKDGSLTDPLKKEISAFVYLDLAELLSEFFPDIWGWVLASQDPDKLPKSTDALKVAFYRTLTQKIREGGETWADGLRRTWQHKSVVTDPEADHSAVYITDLRGVSADAIGTALTAVLPKYALPQQIADPPALPKIDPSAGDFYVLRCVYDRPMCKDLHPSVVSEATVPFQLAGFFDPDAPVRPIRIVMPVNTSIAGLRKFKKGVSFIVSDQLRSQMERFKGLKLKNLDDADIPSGPGYTLGKICSFSIPIITICALILLFIIVQLLNIIFWWIPLLKICFPIKRR